MRGLRFLVSLMLLAAPTAFADNHGEEQQTLYGMSYQITVSDPAALVAAMKTYRQSPTGQQLPSMVTLTQHMADGEAPGTHTINVFYPSAAAMDQSAALTDGSADTAAFRSATSGIMEMESSGMFTMQRSLVNEEALTSDTPVAMLFSFTVTDQAAFNAAFERLWSSPAARDFPGGMFFGSIMAAGELPGTHWVTMQANDMATLMSGWESFLASADAQAYMKNADGFRRIERRAMQRQVLMLEPQQAEG